MIASNDAANDDANTDDLLTPTRPRAGFAGLSIRARESADWREVFALTQLPRVRWGTLRLPFANPEQLRRWMENPQDGVTGIVAVLDGRIVGSADVTQYKGRRSHAGGIALAVHDDHHGCGIGTALMAALVDTADNWLNLKRLELTVFVDNEPAVRLYTKFGFTIEGTHRAEAFRDGRFADTYAMARIHGI